MMARTTTRALLLALAWTAIVLPTLSPSTTSADAFSVEILAIDPDAGETLQRGDALSVRLGYRSDSALRFRIEGFSGGSKIHQIHSSPLPIYPAGQGEALAWLTVNDFTYMDELRIAVLDENWRELRVLSRPVSLHWTQAPRTSPRARPDWVDRLNSAQQDTLRVAGPVVEDDGGFDAWGLAIMLMGWSIPGYLVLQVYTLRRYHHGWRKAALAPLVFTVPLFAYTVFALLAGSNLWPVALLFLTPPCFLYLAGLALTRFVRHRRVR